MTVTATPLVHRRIDGWLLGGFGVVAWLAVTRLPGFDRPLIGSLGGVAGALMLALAAAHFGTSYHLAYAGGTQAVRRHPIALLATPAMLVVACLAVPALVAVGAVGNAEWLTRALLVVVFTLTGWHYIKQAYGVALLSLKLHGLRATPRAVWWLRYGFYPIWLVDLMDVWADGRRASYRKYDVDVGLFPTWVEQAARVLAGGCVLIVLGVLAHTGARVRRVPPMGAWAPYVAGALWFVFPPTYLATSLVIGATHSLQYMTCVHRAEITWARERGEDRLVLYWLSVVGGAAAGGLLFSSWMPRVVDDMITDPALPALAATLTFVALNVHHYAIDAAIWRSRGEHIRRIVQGSAPAMNAVGVASESSPR